MGWLFLRNDYFVNSQKVFYSAYFGLLCHQNPEKGYIYAIKLRLTSFCGRVGKRKTVSAEPMPAQESVRQKEGKRSDSAGKSYAEKG